MNCGTLTSRSYMQQRLKDVNENWISNYYRESGTRSSSNRSSSSRAGGDQQHTQQRADGDAELLPDADYGSLALPHCPSCGSAGVLKPDVVFFGDNVPRATVDFCHAQVSVVGRPQRVR